MTVAGGAIVGGLAMMVKAFGNFDEAMVKSLAIMGDVSPAMREEMAKTAKQLSTKSTFAAKDLAEAYYFLASAGMSAEASISALAPVARFAQAGAFDLAQATDLLTDAQTALGLSSEDVVENEKNLIRVSDVLVGANTLANASVLQFSEALTNKAAAAMVNLNIEVEEGVAVLAAYADKGVKGRLAGQRLTMMLNGLFAATRENKKAWDAAGISLFEADGSFRKVADIIQDMEGHLGKMTVKEREAELAMLGFNIKTKDSILTLMGSSEKIREWNEAGKEMGGITKTVADKQLEAFNAKLTIAKSTIMLAAMGIGKSLAPTIEDLAKKVKSVAEKIAAWIEKHPKLTAFIAKLALGVGGLLLVLGPLLMMLPGIAAGMMLVEKSATLMAIKVKVVTAAKIKWAAVNAKLGLSFKMLLGPIGLVIAAAVTAGIIINKIIDNYKKKQDAEMDAMILAAKGAARLHLFRQKLIADEVVTVEEWAEIYKKHGKDYRRVMIAISKLPEYAHLKAELDAIINKEKELAEETRTNTEEIVSLMSKMADEIFEATHNEFEVRTRMARKTWEERKAVLDSEKAADDAYVMAKKAYTTELKQIEKDRTEKLREEVNERTRSLRASLAKQATIERTYREKIQSIAAKARDIINQITKSSFDYDRDKLNEKYAADLIAAEGNSEAMSQIIRAYQLQKAEILEKGERKFASIIQSYRDIGKEYALSEKEYKLEMLDDWYAEREQQLWDDYGNTQRYYDALAELDKAYGVKRETILVSAFERTMRKIFAGAQEILGGLDAVFAQFHANEAMRIDNEEQLRTDALDSWQGKEQAAIERWYERAKEKIEATITNEAEKIEALEALEAERAEKEATLEEETAEKAVKIEEDIEKKRKKLQLKQAKAQKAAALFSAGINLAEAITKVFAQTGIFGTVASAIVAGLMAVQIAAIAAAPLPSLKEGGIIEKEGIYHLHAGEEVRPAPIVAERMAAAPTYYATVNIYAQRLDDRTINEAIEKIHRALNREMGRYGYG